MKSSSHVFTLFLFPLITCYREISFHLYIAFFRLLGWKKHVLSSLKRKSDGSEILHEALQWALHEIEICSICFFQVWGFFFIFCLFVFKYSHLIGIRQLPKAILKELFNLQLWSSTFFLLFLLYASFKFLELFAYCVPLSASFRTGFSQNKNTVF